ncbi:MAG: DMT family transporter [Pseudorhodobacter sp.]|nr:DMT family transporter [Pseudorhodobacter sp.]
MPPRQSNLKGAALALISFGIYATADAIVKYMGASYSPFQNIFFSTLFGFPLVAIMLMGDQREGNLRPRKPKMTLIRSGLVVLNVLCGFYAFSALPLSEAYPIFFSSPLLITLFAIPMLGEKVGLHRGIAILVGLLGVVVVLRPGQTHLGLGHLAAVAASVIFAVSSILVRLTGQSERSVVIMLYPMIANFIVSGTALAFVYKPMPITHLGLIAAMSALGFIAGILSIAAYRRAQAAIIAPMQYSQIIWASVYGALIFGESHDFWTVVGTLIIMASGVYIVLREGASASRTKPVTEARTRFDLGLMPRLTSLFKFFDAKSADNRDDLS